MSSVKGRRRPSVSADLNIFRIYCPIPRAFVLSPGPCAPDSVSGALCVFSLCFRSGPCPLFRVPVLQSLCLCSAPFYHISCPLSSSSCPVSVSCLVTCPHASSSVPFLLAPSRSSKSETQLYWAKGQICFGIFRDIISSLQALYYGAEIWFQEFYSILLIMSSLRPVFTVVLVFNIFSHAQNS